MLCINPILPDSIKYAKFLLENGADINRQDKAGRTVLLMACHWEEPELIELFLTFKPNLNLSTYTDVLKN